jgi:hypothetical protein
MGGTHDSRGPRLRLPLFFWPVILVLALAPVAGVTLETHSEPAPSGAAVAAPTAKYGHSSQPIPFLPVKVHPLGAPLPATINTTEYYHSEPAPMGIGDFGVGLGGKPYTYNTTEFLGNFSWKSLNIVDAGDAEFTNQLNVVLVFTQGPTTYSYWIQDVAFMNSSNGDLGFEDNIWNFTTGASCLNDTGVQGNGTVYPYQGCEGYYAVGAFGQPGASRAMPTPGDFSLLVRSYKAPSGTPEVAFEYWDGVTSYEVTYDNVVWPWAKSVSTDQDFYVDGNATAPTGNFYDAELTLGGPGGGAATKGANPMDTSSRLFYWNGHNFEAPRSVWNFGSDTAEAISNVQSVFSHDSGGTPLTTQLNGTARNATPAKAYDQGRVGILAISAPSISTGVVSVAGTKSDFVSGQATLTLVPGEYNVWVNSTSQQNDLGLCVILAAETTSVTLPGGCTPVVATPTAAPGGVDLGQSVTFQSALVNPGTGSDTFDWSSLSSDLGCTPSTTGSISCLPSAAGTYGVEVTVTDSASQSNTSGTLEFSVDTDPTVGTPGAVPSTVESGAPVTFSASPSGGSGGYTYSWSGLPSPCTGTTGASPSCHPGSTGPYTVSVTATDSNGYSVTSGTLDFTVSAGPQVATPVASPSGPIDLGQSVNFTVGATGGTGDYRYAWAGLPAGCTSANAAYVECVPTAGGTDSVSVTVTDTDNGAGTSTALDFTVNAAVAVASVSSTPGGVDLGQNVTLRAIGVSGGTGTYAYAWSGLPAGCTANNSPEIPCVPTSAGSSFPNVTVTDSIGGHAIAGTQLVVQPDPTINAIAASRGGADIGQVVNFTAVGVSGGSGNYSYAWTHLPTGCRTQNSVTVSCATTSTGSSSVTVTATDSRNVTGTAELVFLVSPLPTVAAPTASSPTASVGTPVELSVDSTPGSGNLTYTWLGLPTGCASTSAALITCTPSANGTFGVIVTVRDSNGGTAVSGPLSVVVNPPSATVTSSADEYLLLGAMVVVIAAVTVLVIWVSGRRRN